MKPNEKFLSKITVLICITTIEGYGTAWAENFYSCHVKSIT